LAFSAGGDGGRKSPERPAQSIHNLWFRLSQCHRRVLSRTFNTNWKRPP
jgi:hypothetical protein